MPKNKKSQWTPGRFDNTIQAVLYMTLRQVIIQERPRPDYENGPNQVILIINPSARGIDLSNLTVEELDLFQTIIHKGIELARPYCEKNDEEARQAASRNDVRYRRLWRARPRYMDFSKEKPDVIQLTNNSKLPGIPDSQGNQ